MIERDLNKRWEQGIPHHPKSLAIMETIQQLDDGDEFQFGGDGDNGESLLYFLDVHFEEEEENAKL